MPPLPPTTPQTLSQALNQKIRELLAEKRWSQREFAKQLGVTQGAVSYMLGGKRRATVLDYYEKLAGIFGVKLSVLIGELEQRAEAGSSGAGGTLPGTYAKRTSVLALDYDDNTTLVRALVQALIDANIDGRVRAELQRQRNAEVHQLARSSAPAVAKPTPRAAKPAAKPPARKKAASVGRLRPAAVAEDRGELRAASSS